MVDFPHAVFQRFNFAEQNRQGRPELMGDIGNPLLAHAFICFQGLGHGIKIGGQLTQFILGLNRNAGIEFARCQSPGSGGEIADGRQQVF